jgi:hypothetical protein
MNISFELNKSVYDIYINVGNIDEDKEYKLKIDSLYSNEELLLIDLTTVLTNGRYTHFYFELENTDLLKNDINGIYEYIILDDLDNIVDTGLVKIVNKVNGLPTKNYVSNNEKRKSRVLYRPVE